MVGAVDGAQVHAQPSDQLEDQVERILADPHSCRGVGTQSDAGEDALEGVGGAQAGPVLLGKIKERVCEFSVSQASAQDLTDSSGGWTVE